jgi:BirA family biotin operon repressor/biotin-[acetyl-CoA-carboxylase] ligase
MMAAPADPTMTTDSELAAALAKATRFQRFQHVADCTSTQDLAAADVAETDTVYWAEHQSRGRGRQQRQWSDEPGQDLAVTFRLVHLQLANPLSLPAAVPLAVATALEPALGRPLSLKWPNDVFADGKKLAGVLIDARGDRKGQFAIGIGINVNRRHFPTELAATATSLFQLTGRAHDRAALVFALAEALERCLVALTAGDTAGLEDQFRRRLGLLDRRVTVVARDRVFDGRLTWCDFQQLVLDDDRTLALGTVQSLRPAAN